MRDTRGLRILRVTTDIHPDVQRLMDADVECRDSDGRPCHCRQWQVVVCMACLHSDNVNTMEPVELEADAFNWVCRDEPACTARAATAFPALPAA